MKKTFFCAVVLMVLAFTALAIIADHNTRWYQDVQRPHIVYESWIIYDDGEFVFFGGDE